MQASVAEYREEKRRSKGEGEGGGEGQSPYKGTLAGGSFHVKSTQKIDNPSGFSSNLVRPIYIQSNLAIPNFYPHP